MSAKPNRELPDPNAEPTIGVERAGVILGISRGAAYAAVERDEIPAIRVGRRVVVPTAAFLERYRLAAPVAA